MSQIFYERRCRCKEEFLITRKRSNSNTKSEGKAFLYPNLVDSTTKTFYIKCNELSPIASVVLNSFKNKYFYHVIDDILYFFKSNSIEQKTLLRIIYAPVIYLHNNLCVNFFDIWIQEIYINEIPKSNKFLKKNVNSFNSFKYITLKLFYKPKLMLKKQKSLW